MNDYSLSLFSLAKEENLLEEIYQEIRLLTILFNEDDVVSFLEDKFISSCEKKKIINKVFKSKNKYINNFINIVVDDGKEEFLLEMFENFIKLYLKEKNIVKGFVYGAEIANEELKKLEEVISKKINKNVVLEFRQDVSLICGYKVVVDNKLYDNSYKTKLTKLKNKLLEEGVACD